MTTITDAYINALLADATYAKNLLDGLKGDDLERTLSERMTPTLAAFVAENFEVAAHHESNDLPDSGFDATVWRGKIGTQFAGRVYLSMQGTAGLGDFLADIDLTVSGSAKRQFVDMANWWLRITTPINQQARQVRQRPVSAPGQYFEEAPSVNGAGLLLNATQIDAWAQGQVFNLNPR